MPAGDIIEINYEGYGPGGVAVIVETATDNRNRTVAEIRHLMSKGGGSMGENGCVSWKFERKGVIQFSKEKYTEDQLMEAALEAGADDLRDEGDVWEIQTAMADFNAVREAFEAAGLEMISAELNQVPQTTMEVDLETAASFCASSSCLKTTTMSRTSTPTRTSPTKSWLSWKTDLAELF